MKKICLILLTVLIVIIIFISNGWIEFYSENDFVELENLEQIEYLEKENKVEEDILIVKEYTASNGKTYEYIAILNIPSLQIEYPVLSNATAELLKISLNKYWGPNPNKVGNFCIIGHNYNDSRFFGKLNKIKIGDIIELTDLGGTTCKYSVYDTFIVDPNDPSCTSQLTDGKTEITLITCTSTGKQRFIVKAEKVNT